MERNERTSGLIVIVFVLLLLTVGCGDNRINPASVTGPNTTTITMKDGDIADMKKHNAINGVTHRLKGPVIKVYDETGLAQPYLNKWGRIIGLTFVSGPKRSGLNILINNSILNLRGGKKNGKKRENKRFNCYCLCIVVVNGWLRG